MNKKDMVMECLSRLGYLPMLDEDGDVCFIFQLKMLYVAIGDMDEQFLTVIYPYVSVIDDDESPASAFIVCNRMTSELRMMKTFVASDLQRVDATVDFYYYDEDSLLQNMEHALTVLGCARRMFARAHNEIMSTDSD